MVSSRQSWLECGLVQLADGGVISLTVDGLTRAMGLTKGSFYYHFDGVRDYARQLVGYWAQQELSELPDLPRKPDQRLAQLDRFVEAASDQAVGLGAALRLWAQQDEIVRGELERVRAARQKFIRLALEPLAADRERLDLMTDVLQAILAYAPPGAASASRGRTVELYTEFKRLYGLDKASQPDRQARLPI